MRKLLVIGSALMLGVTISSVAVARGPSNVFAVGSAKSEVATVGVDEHASFSAHNTGQGCDATGHIIYKAPSFEFEAKITNLVVETNRAFFTGPITRVKRGMVGVGQFAWFDAVDSGLGGGMGDLFRLANLGPPPSALHGTNCLEPFGGHPITHGNIVIKTTGP